MNSSRNDPSPSPLHALDNGLVEKMLAFAARRFPQELERLEQFPGLMSDASSLQFLAPFTVYVAPVRGRTIVEAFLESRAWSLNHVEREWLEAQRVSPLSIWEVLEVDRGRGILLRDLLAVRDIFVHEVKGSMTMAPHLIVLCRVVESRGAALIAGLYPQPLPPLEGMNVVRRVRATIKRKGVVPLEVLRQPDTAMTIMRLWDDAVHTLMTRGMPELRNTDGDDVLMTTERYRFDPARRAEIARALKAVRLKRENDDTFILLRKKDQVLLGSVILGDGELRVETNSRRRSDKLCLLVEDACGELLTSGLATFEDPRASMDRDDGEEPSPPSAEEIELKRRHYLNVWMKDRIPALEHRTPRQAARSKHGRELLDVLLKEFEYRESQLPERERFDVSELRALWGLQLKA